MLLHNYVNSSCFVVNYHVQSEQQSFTTKSGFYESTNKTPTFADNIEKRSEKSF